MFSLLTFLQQVDIDEKIKNAPDSGYSVGVFIGAMLPFIFLVGLAYLIFRYNKKRIKRDNE